MRFHPLKILAFSSLIAAAACAGESRPGPAAPEASAQAAATAQGLKIGLARIFVDDQDRALRFYRDVLGFTVKDDVSNEGFRWLTVTSPAGPDGVALQLALDSDPAAKAYQEAMFEANEPAIMFFTDDLERDHKRVAAAGGQFTMPPTDIDVAIIAQLPDTCGNLIQISQVD
jgi:predicted enzyme related to lactoylglutathione lyase